MLWVNLYIINTPLTSLSSGFVCFAVGKVVRTSVTGVLGGVLYIINTPLTSLSSCLVCFVVGKVIRPSVTGVLYRKSFIYCSTKV